MNSDEIQKRAKRDQKIIDAVKPVLANLDAHAFNGVRLVNVDDLNAVKKAVDQMIYERNYQDGITLGFTAEQIDAMIAAYQWVVADNADNTDAREAYASDKAYTRSMAQIVDELDGDDLLEPRKIVSLIDTGEDINWNGFAEAVANCRKQ